MPFSPLSSALISLQNRSNAGDAEEDDISADLSKWREAAADLERETKEAGASKSKSSADETSAVNPTPSDLDALSARLSELERQAASLSSRVGRSREGETLLSCAASAREALRGARERATPAFRLTAVSTAAGRGEAAEEKEAEKKKEDEKEEDEAASEANASRIADGARDAARLAGLRGETLRLSAASFGLKDSPSSPSSPLPSLRLEDLEDCTVVVECQLGALVATRLTRCVVFLACPVGGGGGSGESGEKGGEKSSRDQNGGGGGGAVLVDGASASTFFLPAHQCRLHRLIDGCAVYVRSAAPPVIEACQGLRLGPYPVSSSISSNSSSSSSDLVLPASEASLSSSGLGSEEARRSWSRPKDFSWPLAAIGKPSPHWRKIPAAERAAPLPAAGVGAAPVERLFPPPRGDAA